MGTIKLHKWDSAEHLKTDEDTSIRVVTDAGKLRFNILPFPSFFSNRWKQSHE